MPTPRSGVAVAAVGTRVFVLGGQSGGYAVRDRRGFRYGEPHLVDGAGDADAQARFRDRHRRGQDLHDRRRPANDRRPYRLGRGNRYRDGPVDDENADADEAHPRGGRGDRQWNLRRRGLQVADLYRLELPCPRLGGVVRRGDRYLERARESAPSQDRRWRRPPWATSFTRSPAKGRTGSSAAQRRSRRIDTTRARIRGVFLRRCPAPR